jgi:hypothetical protein
MKTKPHTKGAKGAKRIGHERTRQNTKGINNRSRQCFQQKVSFLSDELLNLGKFGERLDVLRIRYAEKFVTVIRGLNSCGLWISQQPNMVRSNISALTGQLFGHNPFRVGGVGTGIQGRNAGAASTFQPWAGGRTSVGVLNALLRWRWCNCSLGTLGTTSAFVWIFGDSGEIRPYPRGG